MGRRRSGNIYAVNDPWVFRIIEDDNYNIYKNGKIFTLIARNGRKSKVWRETGFKTCKDGYKYVCYDRKDLKVHRVIYAKHGETSLSPDMVVHHDDCNPANNNIANLMAVSQYQNLAYRDAE